MRNLARLNNAANRIAALNDWNALSAKALEMDRPDLVAKHIPHENAGWRKIDKQIAKLRDALGGE